MYINNWDVLCFLVDCLLAGLGWNCLCIYSILPGDGLQTCPKHVEVD